MTDILPTSTRSYRTIDAHQHFWRYSPQEYEWIEPRMQALQRDLLPEHLEPELKAAQVDGVITVQARQTLAETEWLLELSRGFPWIRGVVGWAPISSAELGSVLNTLCADPALKGLRHIVQSEPDPEFLLRSDFNHGIDSLLPTGLVYDLLIVARQLPQTIAFVDRHPNQIFVLDHIAKPEISFKTSEPWRGNLCELARRPNVYCKLSGMVTEAVWDCWQPEDLWPYIEVVLAAFGAERVMAGSDWPVCTLAASYCGWTSTLKTMLCSLSRHEQARIFGETAIEAYRLDSA